MSRVKLHPYICEGCIESKPELELSELEYLQAIDNRGRLLCDSCRTRLNGGATEKGRDASSGSPRTTGSRS